MNKTISVNISGFVFYIEEQAYENLKIYLDQVRNNFSNEDERDEIMDDIEMRVAELFQERTSASKEAITQTDIDEIIAILGHPEDFLTDEDETQHSKQQYKSSQAQYNTIRKRLFRDMDNAAIGGVCSGLGHYFEVDALIFRIIFLILFVFFGTGVLLYIILIIVVPEAKTTSDKIEMKGLSVNVESIKEHVATIKQKVSETAKSSNVRENIKSSVNKGIKASSSFFEVLAKIMGVVFMTGGIVLFVLLMLLTFGDIGIIPFIGENKVTDIPELISIVYPGDNPSSTIFIALITVLSIPLISLIVTGVRILFNYKRNMKEIGWSLAIIWTVAATILLYHSIHLATDFTNEKEISYSIPLDSTVTDVIFIDVMDDDQFSNHIDPYNPLSSAELLKVDEEYIYLGFCELNVKATLDSANFRVNLIKETHAGSAQEAIGKIERISYPIDVNGNKIIIPPYIKFPKEDKIRGQFVDLEIIIPSGKKVKFGDNISRIWCDLEGVHHYHWVKNFTGTEWTNASGMFLETTWDEQIE